MIKRNTLIKRMEAVVLQDVEHYRNDFYHYDIEWLKDMKPGDVYAWTTRESGTHLSSSPDYIETILNYYRDGLRSYHIIKRVRGGYELEKITLDQLRDWIKATRARQEREKDAA